MFGRNWAGGGNPYITVWDQKGPVIFFLNMLGYLLTGSRFGVYILQTVSLAIALYFMYRLLCEAFSAKQSALLTFFSLFALLNNYSDTGNCVEEWLLPLLVPSFWLLYKWTKRKDWPVTNFAHPYLCAFLYGAAFAFSLLTRLTNALGICGAVFFVFLLLVCKRQGKNLALNIVAFILGFLVLFVPFAIYFLMKGTFDEMWYATFTFNVDYAKNAPKQVVFSFNQWLYLFKSAITGIILFFVSVSMILFYPKRRMAGWLWLSVDVFSMAWLMTSNGFNHYFIITFPYFGIILCELRNMQWLSGGNRIYRKALVAYPLVLAFACSYEIFMTFRQYAAPNPNLPFYDTVNHDMGKDNAKTFLAYNTSPYIYLYLDRQPAMRFFTYQSSQMSFSQSLKPKLVKSFKHAMPYWVLAKGDVSAINYFLLTRYIVYRQYPDGYVLWRRQHLQ